MSLRSPDLKAAVVTPSFCRSPSAFSDSMMTPIEPVTVVGWATIVSAASAT